MNLFRMFPWLSLAVFLSLAPAVAGESDLPFPLGNGCRGTCLPSCELPPGTRLCAGVAWSADLILSCDDDRPGNQQLFWRRSDDGLGYYFPPARVCPVPGCVVGCQ